MKPAKKLIQETKAIIRLQQFLWCEVGLREDLFLKDLRALLNALKTGK
ncbi:MAG: hypothetical protein WC510_02070 [Candidatus Omnitrophota bacterium]